MIYKLATYQDGSTALISHPDEGGSMHVDIDDNPITQTHILPVSDEEFVELQHKAVTHDIKSDTMSGEIMLTPKNKTDGTVA